MNLKLRLKNKVTLTALVLVVIAFVYQILAIFNITPTISQTSIESGVEMLFTALVGLGVLVDPTTSGVGDSELAMSYTELGGNASISALSVDENTDLNIEIVAFNEELANHNVENYAHLMENEDAQLKEGEDNE